MTYDPVKNNFFFWVGLGFELKLCACKGGTLMLEPHHQFILLWLFGDGVSGTICLGWLQSS
jgi:hypothetical protein